MQHKPLGDRFAFVSPNWRYAISTDTHLIGFDAQPDGKWLASRAGGKEIRVLSDKVTVKMLNQALQGGMPVVAVEISTGHYLCFQRKPKAAPAKQLHKKQSV